MKCDRFARWIDRKLEGSLPEDQLRELDDHLNLCRRCRDELMLQKSLVEALTEGVPSGLSADFTQRVSTRVLEMDARKKLRRWPALAPVLALGVTGAVIALLVGDPMQTLTWKALGHSFSTAFGLIGDDISRLLSHLPVLSGTAGSSASPLLVVVVGTLLSGISMIWSFRRMFAFLRE